MKINRYLKHLVYTLTILAIPFNAMQFTNEVRWDKMDFVVAGVIIYTAVLALGCIFRQIKSSRLKWALAVGLFALAALVWAELAVGLIS